MILLNWINFYRNNGLYRDMYNFDDINFGNFPYVIIKV